MVIDVKTNEIAFAGYLSNHARRVKVVASRPDTGISQEWSGSTGYLKK
jgi:hypothetical protein